MKPSFSVLLLIFWICCLLPAQTKLDSLESELKTAKDTNRVNILESLAREYARLNPEKALGYTREGEKLGKQIRYEKGQLKKEKAEALLLAGAIRERQGKFDEALPILEQVLEVTQSFHFPKIYIRTLINIANIHLRKSDY